MPPLDGIRGLAILAVMIYHFFLYGGMKAGASIDRLAIFVADAGWVGVDLFFVLSGFLITGILFDSRGEEAYFRRFYTRRALRIFPLYYLALFGFFVAGPLVFGADLHKGSGNPAQWWYWTYLANVKIALFGWNSTFLPVSHFWSLAIEEQFYLVWPFLVFALSRQRLLGYCAVIAIVSPILRALFYMEGASTAAYVLTPARMDALAIGAALALMMRDPAYYRILRRLAIPALALGVAFVAGVAIWRHGWHKWDPAVGTVGITALSLSFAALIFLSTTLPKNRALVRAVSAAPLRSLGKYSYALYVFHQPIALALGAAGFSAALVPRVGNSGLPGQAVFAVVAGTVSIVAALCSWHLFEKHFLRLKDKLTFGKPKPAVREPSAVPSRPVEVV